MSPPVAVDVRLSLFASGCLSELINKEIVKVERHRKLCGDGYSKETAENISQYLAQLRECFDEVERARRTLAA